MSSNKSYHRSGLILAPPDKTYRSTGPLRDGPDVSWLSMCRVGDDQGQEGACAIFAMASWAEIMHGYNISDEQCLNVYRATLKKLGRDDGGLTFAEAFAAAHSENWLPGARAIARVSDLTALTQQPIVAGYAVTPAWDSVSSQGCLDHKAGGTARGYHAVVIVAHGTLNRVPDGPLVYIENSWGRAWGWNGIGVMTEKLHRALCSEMWTII